MGQELIDVVREFKEKFLIESLNLEFKSKEDIVSRLFVVFTDIESSVIEILSKYLKEDIDTEYQINELYSNLLRANQLIAGYPLEKKIGNNENTARLISEINSIYNHIYRMIHLDRLHEIITGKDIEFIKKLENNFYNFETNKIKEFNEQLRKDGIETRIEIEDE